MRIVTRLSGLVLAGLLAAGPVWAQDAKQLDHAGAELSQDWTAFGIASGHVQKALSSYVAAAGAAERQAADAEAKLKWVLDNWVPQSKSAPAR